MKLKLHFVRIAIIATTCIFSMLQEAAGAQSGAPAGMSSGWREGSVPRRGPAARNRSRIPAKVYELSHVRSSTMPLSPFAGPFEPKYLPTGGLPGTTQLFNMEVLNENANPAQQGTQLDALGHFAHVDKAWDGTSPLSAEGARYYGGFTQKDVKPTPDSPLLKLGMDTAPPIVTTAILLDAKKHVGGGKPMKAGEVVTYRSNAAGPGASETRHSSGRRGVRLHRLERPISGPRNR